MYPNNKKFAFTILDDTDSATLRTVEPVYRYLQENGFRTTKTVWPLAYEGAADSIYGDSTVLEDPDYQDFIRWLHSMGFEVTWHGPTMESSLRETVLKGLESFKQSLGFYPSLHINHAHNRDNLYWGLDRFDSVLIKLILKIFAGYKKGEYGGHLSGSRYYWGDVAQQYFKYCRGFTYDELNVLNVNPSFPYRDERRDQVDYWFSSTSVDNIVEFEEKFTKEKMQALIRQRGICIVSTHLGKGYVKNGKLRDSVVSRLNFLLEHDGWFAPVSEILDWRLQQGFGRVLSSSERRVMEWKWFYESVKSKIARTNKSFEWWGY